MLTPRDTQIRQNRNLTLTLALLFTITNTLTTAALHFLPSDPLHLAFNFALYTSCGALISVLGLIGVCTHSPTLITIFSNHLFLDALLSTVPRILLLALFSSLPSSVCTSFIMPSATSTTGTPRWEGEAAPWTPEPWMARRCTTALWVVEGMVGVCILGLTAVQWGAAWRVRDYAMVAEGWEGRRCSAGEKLEDGESEEEKRLGL